MINETHSPINKIGQNTQTGKNTQANQFKKLHEHRNIETNSPDG